MNFTWSVLSSGFGLLQWSARRSEYQSLDQLVERMRRRSFPRPPPVPVGSIQDHTAWT